jgi:adenine-specific DNA-methyltransferase
MWYSKTDDYFFDLDPVRIPSKYPGKRHFKGPKKGELSGNPLGKNPEDVWDIPNVKSNHVEKTDHPCQFPVGLIERLVLSMTRPGDLVFDPFSGVGSAGVAAAIHQRRFWGCEILPQYAKQAKSRIDDALNGVARYRPHDQALYDHTKSKLSKVEVA